MDKYKQGKLHHQPKGSSYTACGLWAKGVWASEGICLPDDMGACKNCLRAVKKRESSDRKQSS